MSNITALGDDISIRRFIEFIISGCEDGYIAIVGILNSDGKKTVNPYFFKLDDISSIEEKCKTLIKSKYDVYIQPTLLKGIPNSGRGKKSAILGGNVLWIDRDVKVTDNKEQILAELKNIKPEPSWINFSGYGYHVYWKLDQFTTNIKEIEARNRNLALKYNGDACYDAGHVLRLPGTINFKRNSEVTVKIIHVSNNKQHNLSDFEISSDDEDEGISQLELQEEPLPNEFLKALDENIRYRIEHGPPDGGDRSSNDFFVAVALLEAGFTPGQILTLFLDENYEVGNKAFDNHGKNFGYISRTIKNALSRNLRNIAASPKSPIQTIIDKILYKDPRGTHKRLDLPAQGYHLVLEACEYLKEQQYKFVYDILDGGCYVIDKDGRVIQASSTSPEFAAWVSTITLFTSESKAYRMFHSGIMSYIGQHGQKILIRPWVSFDPTTNTGYILTDHTTSNQLAVISTKGIELTSNAQGDTLFLPSPRTATHDISYNEITPDDIKPTIKRLHDLTYEYFACPNEMKQFLTTYLYAAFLAPSFLKQSTLPFLHFIGSSGQGKTEALKILSAFIHGTTDLESGTTLAAARSIAARDILIPFDDYESLPKHMRDFILTSATGAVRHKVSLSSLTTVAQRNHILLALTSTNDLPTDTLRRRALQIAVSQKEFPTENYNAIFKERLMRQRSEFISAMMHMFVNDVLPKLNDTSLSKLAKGIANNILAPEFRPHSDFLALCAFIGGVLSKYDARFRSMEPILAGNVAPVGRWLSYFQMLSNDVMTEFNDFVPSIEAVFENYLRDVSLQNTGIRIRSARSPTGAMVMDTPQWLRGLVVEVPGAFIPNRIPFDLNHTVCISGKATGWVTTLLNIGRKELFDANANGVRKFHTSIKQSAGFNVPFNQLIAVDNKSISYSEVYRLRDSNVWIQVVIPKNSQPLFRIFYPVDADVYTVPDGGQANPNSLAIEQIRAKLKKSLLSKEEAVELLELLNEYKERLASNDGQIN